MAKDLNLFEKSVHEASQLVKKWGDQGPPGEARLRELLTIDGVSMWDVLAVELALYHVPDALAKTSSRKTLRQRVVSSIRAIKYAFGKKLTIDISDCKRWPSGKTVLFLWFTPYLARDVLQSVVDKLLRESELTSVMLTEKHVPSNDVSSHMHSISRHRGKATVKKARNFSRSIRSASRLLFGRHRYQRIFKHEGRQLWPYLKEGLFRAIKVQAGFHLPEIVAVAKHILTDHRPAAIVSIDVADPRTRVFSILAKTLNIPTIQIQSGVVDQGVVEWKFLYDDIVAAQGVQARDVFISQGVPREKIIVTGNPRYDKLIGAADSDIEAFRERFGIPDKNRIILLASSYFLGVHEVNLAETGQILRDMKKAMFSATVSVPGISLVVKPHPLEQVDETRALVTDGSRISFADKGEDIRDLISMCDVYFTFGSTATLDGLILGKPTVCPAFPGWMFSETFLGTGAVMSAHSKNDIIAAFSEIAADGGAGIYARHADKRNEYLSSVVRDGGKGATDRIVKLLEDIT